MHHKKTRRKYLLVLLISFVIMLFAVPAILFSVKLSNINCETNISPCSEHIKNSINERLGRSRLIWLYFNTKKIENDIKESISAKNVKISLNVLLRAVRVKIDFASFVGIISTPSSKQYIIGEGGVVGEKDNREGKDLPILEINSETITNTHISALKKLSTIANTTSKECNGVLVGNDLIVSLQDKVQILIDVNSQSDQWLTSLQAILDRSRMGGEVLPHKIDLRFGNPVLSK